VVIGVGDGGAQIAAAAHGVEVAIAVPDAAEASRAVDDTVRPGDAVLVKASRALGLQTVAARLIDREPVR
jgi:UDP-N-acetylmuramoyl-tripeptide--D-alanyl-D-alanine ligase